MTITTNSHEITGTRNEYFDLFSLLYHALEGVTSHETYIQDAEKCGDTELLVRTRKKFISTAVLVTSFWNTLNNRWA